MKVICCLILKTVYLYRTFQSLTSTWALTALDHIHCIVNISYTKQIIATKMIWHYFLWFRNLYWKYAFSLFKSMYKSHSLIHWSPKSQVPLDGRIAMNLDRPLLLRLWTPTMKRFDHFNPVCDSAPKNMYFVRFYTYSL